MIRPLNGLTLVWAIGAFLGASWDPEGDWIAVHALTLMVMFAFWILVPIQAILFDVRITQKVFLWQGLMWTLGLLSAWQFLDWQFNQAKARADAVILRAQIFHAEHGAWPQTLEALGIKEPLSMPKGLTGNREIRYVASNAGPVVYVPISAMTNVKRSPETDWQFVD